MSQSKTVVTNNSHYQLKKYHLHLTFQPQQGRICLYLDSSRHLQNKQDLMDDFSNPVDKNIVNVLSFEEPFPQISSPGYRNVPVAFKNIQRSYLSPEFRNTSVLKKRTNKSTQKSLARPLHRSTSKILIL